ncbi:arginine deiminase family protein [Proteinivorax hydrogeniformans]|uniref:Arginine deiminase family protein n=1 Tax=Proteinivorax hydrogeniformans TaxID=1826727 RepID=A0AAU8HW99_9FIRM
MQISISNCYDSLRFALMAFPSDIAVTVESQEKYQFNKTLACNQYNLLVNTLLDFGVEVRFLDQTNSPTQIYTRDVGFILNDTIFISKMSEDNRQQETESLIDFVNQHNLKSYKMQEFVEGGDVFVHEDKVIIGIGERTTENAAQEISQQLNYTGSNYRVIKAYFDLSLIHLDCAFNILDKDTCLITDGLFNADEISKFFPKVIKTPFDKTTLGPNIINLGNKTLLCSNQQLANTLNQNGFKVIHINYEEVAKVSGGLGCSILPILRSK